MECSVRSNRVFEFQCVVVVAYRVVLCIRRRLAGLEMPGRTSNFERMDQVICIRAFVHVCLLLYTPHHTTRLDDRTLLCDVFYLDKIMI